MRSSPSRPTFATCRQRFAPTSWSSASARAAKSPPRRSASSGGGSCSSSAPRRCTAVRAPTWAAYRPRRSSTKPASAGRPTPRRSSTSARSATVQEVRAFMRDGNFAALDGAPTITVITGAARFIDPHTVDVDVDGDRITISAETILINTGSEPVVPDALAWRSRTHAHQHGADRAAGAPEAPGDRRRGLPRASSSPRCYQRFGSQVTLLEQSPRILEHEDDDVAGEVERILRDEGVEIITGAHVAAIRDEADHSTVVFADGGMRQELEADAILAADGPRAGDARARARSGRGPDHRGAAPSPSTSTCAPASGTSSRSATSRAGRSSRTSRSTTAGSCSISWSARDGGPPATASPSHARCSSRRRWRRSG